MLTPLGNCGDPLAANARRCDCAADCWRTHFDTDEELQVCLEDCGNEVSECIGNCVPDLSEAAATQAGCIVSCDEGHEDCVDGCYEVWQNCVDDCPPFSEDPDGNQICLATCSSSLVGCLPNCEVPWGKCRAGCNRTYQVALIAAEGAQLTCRKPCCSPSPNHIESCRQQAEITHYDQGAAAQLAYTDCLILCITHYDGISYGYDAECSLACSNTLGSVQHLVARLVAVAQYDCEVAFGNTHGVCDDYDACGSACLDTFLTAQDACYAAQQDGAEEYDTQVCMEEALQARLSCDMQCCFHRYGVDADASPALDCLKTRRSCGLAASQTCPYPTAVCEDDPESAECLEALADREECLVAEGQNCLDAYNECLLGLPDGNPCTGCADFDV